MKKLSCFPPIIAGLFLLATVCFAGTVTLDDRLKCATPEEGGGCIRVLKWTYDSGGVATAITGSSASDATNCIGYIKQLISVPSTTTAPDNDFDVEILDQSYNGTDILNGAGDDLPSDCSTANQEDECRRTPVDAENGGNIQLIGETLRFWIDNMDDSTDDADGDIILVIELPKPRKR